MHDEEFTPTKKAPQKPPTSLISPTKNEINSTYLNSTKTSWNTFDSSWADGEFESIDEPGTGKQTSGFVHPLKKLMVIHMGQAIRK
jgi:hypothetical protein